MQHEVAGQRPEHATPEFTPVEIRRAVLASVIGNGLSIYASFQMSSQGVAAMLAALAVLALAGLVSKEALIGWAWRVPFLLGAVVGPVGFYIRRRVAVSPEFAAARRWWAASRTEWGPGAWWSPAWWRSGCCPTRCSPSWR